MTSGRGMSVLVACALAVAAGALAATEIDLTVTTPAIERIQKAMQGRAEEIAKYKDYAYIGEGREGLLAVRSLKGVKLEEKKRIEDVVNAENNDRKAHMREILSAHGLSNDRADDVIAAYAEKRWKEAAPGHWVQDEKGEWKLARELK